MLQALGGCSAFFWDVLHHGQEEVRELGCLLEGPLIFLHQDLVQAPVLEILNVAQFPWGRKEDKKGKVGGEAPSRAVCTLRWRKVK